MPSLTLAADARDVFMCRCNNLPFENKHIIIVVGSNATIKSTA